MHGFSERSIWIREAGLCLLALLMIWFTVAPSEGAAQEPVTVGEVRTYVSDLESSYWERAWLAHLQEKADREGRIEWAYEDRQQLNDLTTDYQQAIGEAEGFWVNLQVQDFLQQQLLEVQPNPMMPGRPGTFRLRVLSTSTPNTLALNDGTILLTTGLLAALESEAELQALLAHQVAHVVLDHALVSYQSGQRRNRARQVLSNIVSGVSSAVAPGFTNRGPVESTVYGLSRGLATHYLDREFIAAAGLEYSREQERAANRLAQQWLLAHERPPEALHGVLTKLHRIGTYSKVTHGPSFLDSHPGQEDRREMLGSVLAEAGKDPALLDGRPDGERGVYDAHVAAVLEHEAEIEVAARRFHSAVPLLERALGSDWSTARAYLLKAIVIRNTQVGPDGRKEAFALLESAEAAIDTPEPRIDAERALLLLRQGRTEAARQQLRRCLEHIERARADGNQGRTSPDESLSALKEWATEMERRLGG